MLQVKSTHNTPIEGCWHWFQKTMGKDFGDIIRSGLQDGIYYPNDERHMCVSFFLLSWTSLTSLCDLESFSDGYGPRYYRNHLIPSSIIGTIIVFVISPIKQMSPEPLLVRHSQSQNLTVDRIAGSPLIRPRLTIYEHRFQFLVRMPCVG